MSTNTQHVTLKSSKMSDNDNKQTNYRLMNVLCCTKEVFADFSNISINISPIGISLNMKFSIPTKTLEKCSHFLASLKNHLV